MKNAISVVRKDLEKQRVKVFLPDFGEERDLFLIGVDSTTSTFEDFKTTFAGKATMTEIIAAKKVFGENETKNKYGVFVDNHFQMVYFFNLLFGDYDKEKRIVVYKTPQEILLKAPLVKMLTETKDPLMFNPK